MSELTLLGCIMLYLIMIIGISIKLGIELEKRFNMDGMTISLLTVAILLSLTLICAGLLI